MGYKRHIKHHSIWLSSIICTTFFSRAYQTYIIHTCSRRRKFISNPKACHPASTTRRHPVRLLLPLLHSSKGRQRHQTHPRSQNSKYLPSTTSVSYGHLRFHHSPVTPKRLVRGDRPRKTLIFIFLFTNIIEYTFVFSL